MFYNSEGTIDKDRYYVCILTSYFNQFTIIKIDTSVCNKKIYISSVECSKKLSVLWERWN